MGFFDVINISGLIFTVVLLMSHIFFAKAQEYEKSAFDNRAMLYIARIGRYCSAFLMFVNIGVLEQGFTSDLMQNYWMISTSVLLAVYLLLWFLFVKLQSKAAAYAIVFIAAVIIIQSGLLQVKTLLFTFGFVYLAGDLYLATRYFKNKGRK